ncbi:hypothetical protein DVH05_009390 [Phytophthora capsici]|nr:hypothetical protein DVH05_026829 [Phytophthora capsici]KAG1702440.1 hypothetical protein DVH05_009390 [Phytophthora capsici]
MSALKKTRDNSVREYTRSFQKPGRMIQYIEDNEAIPMSDVIRMYKSGMPVNWQVNRLWCSWEYRDLRNNDADIECFRNPDSPAYRPRPNNRTQPKSGGNGQAFAAMEARVEEMAAMMEAMKRCHEEELSAYGSTAEMR